MRGRTDADTDWPICIAFESRRLLLRLLRLMPLPDVAHVDLRLSSIAEWRRVLRIDDTVIMISTMKAQTHHRHRIRTRPASRIAIGIGIGSAIGIHADRTTTGYRIVMINLDILIEQLTKSNNLDVIAPKHTKKNRQQGRHKHIRKADTSE